MARYTAPMKPGTGISDFAAPGGKYSVIYRGDTGKRWVLEIFHRNVPMPGKPVIEFDYNTFEIVPDKNAKEMVPDLDALVAGVREALVATVGLQIKADSEHIRILDILAQGLMLEDIWIKGPILRRTMKDLSPERGERLAEMIPRYVAQRGDSFSLALPGALNSSSKPTVVRTLEVLLPALSDLYNKKLELGQVLSGYGWRDLREVKGFNEADVNVVRAIIQIAGLHIGGLVSGGADFRVGVPKDMEQIAECRTLESFLEYLRRNGDERSPTGPIGYVLPPPLPPEPTILSTNRGPMTSSSPWRPTPWAFISSVSGGFENYRDRATRACLRARVLPVSMESWSAASRPSIEVCRNEVRSCDVVLLVFGHRYGSIHPETGRSYTEVEFDEAKASGRDVLAFEVTAIPSGVTPDEIDPEDVRQRQAFKKRLGDHLRGLAENPDQLETRILQSLKEWREEKEKGRSGTRSSFPQET